MTTDDLEALVTRLIAIMREVCAVLTIAALVGSGLLILAHAGMYFERMM